MDLTRFYQIDADYRRRAQFVKVAQALGAHAEPFDSAIELAEFAPAAGVILVHDDGEAVAGTIDRLEAAGVALPLIAYREAPDPERVVDVINVGAADYISWPVFPATLRRRLTMLAQRAPEAELAKVRRAAAQKALGELSPREMEVLTLLAGGLSNKEMATVLGISPRTVEIHRANMMTKLGQSSAPGAIYLAYDAGVVAPATAFNERKTIARGAYAATNS